MGYTAIIPAAGLGKRMGMDYNKVFIRINEMAVIQMTVSQFEKDDHCEAIYLAARADEIESMNELFSDSKKVKGIFAGGSERQDSIYNVLKQIPKCRYVMIHDGARPFVTKDTLDALYESVKVDKAVICGVNVKDTIKIVDDGLVTNTVPRERLFVVHTPQAFDYDLILKAHREARENQLAVTDDAMMVEELGCSVSVVPSNYDNIKITTTEDLIIAEAILQRGDLG